MPVALLLALFAVPPAQRPFTDERQLLDRRLETLRRMLPDGYDTKSDVAHVRHLADEAGLTLSETLARPPDDVRGQDRGYVVIDVTGLGLYVEIDRFFRQVALSHRLVDVASLSLTPTPNELVQVQTVLRFPYRPQRAPLPPPPIDVEPLLAGVPRSLADAFRRDEAIALAKSSTVEQLRRARRNPRLFLSELAAIVRERPVVLTHATLDDGFRVRGVTIGEGPARELETRLEQGFFRLDEFLIRQDGACHRFEAIGTSPVVGPEAVLPLPAEDPFVQDDAPCKVDRDRGDAFEARAPRGGKPGPGPITLRLRDVDLSDAFFALHRLTGQSFVVDGNVIGRISTEIMGATLEEAITAVAGAASLVVSPPGPIRRVAREGVTPRTWPVSSEGRRASFRLKRAPVRDVLAIMADAEPGLAALGPPGSLGQLSLWTGDVPLVALRAAMLEAAGLAERVEEGQILLERPTGGENEELTPVSAPLRTRRLVLAPEELTTREFWLAGLGTAGGGWTALVYSPTGALDAYVAGDRLVDGSVQAVYSNDARLESGGGTVRAPLPTMR